MTNSLPHAQKLFAQYQGDDRVRVVAVATAFEKATYPWMADVDKIRARLRAEGWKFPVMRDKHERIIHTFSMGRQAGTPTTVVLDRDGVVRWHGFNTNPKTAQEVADKVAELLESFYVAPIRAFLPDLKKVGEAYLSGNYGRAYAAAARLAEADDTGDAARAQAREVIENLAAGVHRLIDESAAKRARGQPRAARRSLEVATKVFKSVPAVEDARKQLAVLRADAAFKAELKAERAFLKLEAAAAGSRVDRAVLRKRLQQLREKYPGSPVVQRIEALERRISLE